MRDKYPEYFPPSDETKQDVWQTGLIVLDTSALLNAFRYEETAREALLNALRSNADQLWIPAQVANEFLNKRESVTRSVTKQSRDIENEVDKTRDSLLEFIRKAFRVHPFLDREALEKATITSFGSISDHIHSARDQFDDTVADATFATLVELYDGKVGTRPSDEEQETLDKESERRKQKTIPPGYKDDSHGDYTLWAQLLEKVQEADSSVIFVTDDLKEDWWQSEAGRRTPRPELIREFNKHSSGTIIFYQPQGFLTAAAEKAGSVVDPDTLQNVESVSTWSANIDSTISRAIKRGQLRAQREHLNSRLEAAVQRRPTDMAFDEQRSQVEEHIRRLEGRQARGLSHEEIDTYLELLSQKRALDAIDSTPDATTDDTIGRYLAELNRIDRELADLDK
ncbi:PIN domain-containing protein [Curtobacterium flaccumfaciens]|uniref:PIN domain-containing protein n=1 Tax=Curtobacterium flaccumfaciens TaxID=2035 RepID=UPI001266D46E|nr:PIN domain-containing protein [Curtobacterium flaccumfaciens]MBT1664368.1 DUF4935 domain-containing protein [Curtobacterium flaccumfaciens pv. flaccumfaciens]QFS79189.1 DUF4935 domain-containing protein [Curtobacterium flaccumfaciens pv. flaccumfaciens]